MKIGIQTNFAAHSNEALIDKYDKFNPKCHRHDCLFTVVIGGISIPNQISTT